jgi:anthranilate synthase component 1
MNIPDNQNLMSEAEFNRLAADNYNRIPLYREILADLDTPVSSYLKLANGPYSYLFESVQGGEKWGRYSFIGLPCKRLMKVCGHQATFINNGKIEDSREFTDPLHAVKLFHDEYRIPELPELPRFTGGLVGYFGYDTVRYAEPKLEKSTPEDEINTPDILMMVSEEVLVFDNLAGKILIVNHVDPSADQAYERGMQRIDELEQQLLKPVEISQNSLHIDPAASLGKTPDEQAFKSGFNKENFQQAVGKIKEYILAGDTMQVVLSQRLSIDFEAEPFDLYRALRNLNPSPYMYHLNLDDFQIVGSSPEILARLEDDTVTVRPIAGTRRRGYTETEDLALEQELLDDPKEIAEHLMLIDLGRNDVGRVAETGSVELTDKMIVERYSHVMHITSNVTGQIKPGLDCLDVLRATLPAGTLSGAPKIRAMEIIDELEPVKRGVYGGAVGYLGWNGNMDTAIAIRTAVIKNKKLYIQAGAGVVADSVPELEWKETMNKARAIFKAVAMVNQSREEN